MNMPYDYDYFVSRHEELLQKAELARQAAEQRRHLAATRPGRARRFRRTR
jgi:hypothetical protein